MEWVRSDGFLVTDERDRIDVETVHRWLSGESYWATGRSRELVERSIEGSITLGCFSPADALVGITRLVTDAATIGVVTDVFVDAPYRGQGLGQFLVGTIMSLPEARVLKRVLLATDDAHELYARFGFSLLSHPERWMERTTTAGDPSTSA
jgi:N-acetylglutamate synthase-like GNAT family acetyltransferase